MAIVCSLTDALQMIRPGAEWTLSGETYAGLNWIDTVQSKPMLQEIATAQTACLAAQTPAGILAGERASAISELNTGTQPLTKLERAILLVTLDEVNLIRSLLVPAQPPRTITQFKNAVQTKINSGAAD